MGARHKMANQPPSWVNKREAELNVPHWEEVYVWRSHPNPNANCHGSARNLMLAVLFTGSWVKLWVFREFCTTKLGAIDFVGKGKIRFTFSGTLRFLDLNFDVHK